MIDAETAGRLLSQARAAADRAYVPYSRFPVGAAVLAPDGSVYTGANIENASYPLTCCAERVAVFRAVMDGQTALAAVAVWAKESRGVTPCGACRQVLNEWQPEDGELAVILEGSDGPETITLGELLPRSFGPRNLGTAESG